VIVGPHCVLLDAEALSALAVRDRRAQAWTHVLQRTDSVLYVSTLTLAEVTDGTARDAAIRRTVNTLRLVPVTHDIAYEAGRLRTTGTKARRKPRDLTVDAVVAATALTLRRPTVVLTCDPHDLTILLATADPPVRVESL